MGSYCGKGLVAVAERQCIYRDESAISHKHMFCVSCKLWYTDMREIL